MGLNCNNNDSKDLAEKISILIEDGDWESKWGRIVDG